MNDRKLATVETVASLAPIEGADRIEVAGIRGWKVVVGKNQFAIGEQVIYFEVDACLPLDDPRFTKFGERSTKTLPSGRDVHVLRTIKLRGQVSQGLVMGLGELGLSDDLTVGDDLTDALGIVKWMPSVEGIADAVGSFTTQFADKTDSERVQNLSDDILAELAQYDWQATEKVDGCLRRDTPITMADGSQKHIKDIEPGDMVLGMVDGLVVPSLVKGVSSKVADGQWVKVRGKRVNRGRGHATFSVKATDNHPFFVPGRGYVPAGELRSGDKVLCLHYDITPTKVQESIMIGSLLGDGTLTAHGSVGFSHSEKQEDYHQWLIDALGPIVRGSRRQLSGYGSEMTHTMLAVCHGLNLDGWDKPRGVVPRSVIDIMNPLTLAVWYMDDGSLTTDEGQEYRATFSTNSFNDESIGILIEALAKLGVGATTQPSAKGTSIRVYAESADLMFMLIAPYIPPSMQYKLPVYYRGGEGWFPRRTDGYRPLVSEVTVDEVVPLDARFRRYDIETETSNFFASRILVHNSSVTVTLTDEGVRVCSRNLEVGPASMHHRAVVASGILDLMAVGDTVQGEIVGPGVNGNRLRLDAPRIIVFDLWRNRVLVARDEWPAWAVGLAAPVLDLPFPATVDEAVEQVNKMASVVNPQVQAEGIVWHTVDGSQPVDGRSTFKAINNAYLLKHGE